MVNNYDGRRVQLKRLEPNEARETLGIFIAMDRNKNKDYWLGITDKAVEGKFWLDSYGFEALFTEFKSGEPQNTDDKDCVIAGRNDGGKWSMSKCVSFTVSGFLCEMRE